MDTETKEKLGQIINDYRNRSNSDLIFAMDSINKEFESTKEYVIKLTHHLDYLEKHYNDILTEYKQRTNT